MEKIEELKRIGGSIRKQRLLKEMTQAQLAERASVSVQTISKAERGETELRIKTILKISLLLKVSLKELTEQ